MDEEIKIRLIKMKHDFNKLKPNNDNVNYELNKNTENIEKDKELKEIEKEFMNKDIESMAKYFIDNLEKNFEGIFKIENK